MEAKLPLTSYITDKRSSCQMKVCTVLFEVTIECQLYHSFFTADLLASVVTKALLILGALTLHMNVKIEWLLLHSESVRLT